MASARLTGMARRGKLRGSFYLRTRVRPAWWECQPNDGHCAPLSEDTHPERSAAREREPEHRARAGG
jgi:hypothetical protein